MNGESSDRVRIVGAGAPGSATAKTIDERVRSRPLANDSDTRALTAERAYPHFDRARSFA